ncbi:MAG: isopentenyl-diphosphate Delta-isomerase [Crocinitomicaceae bacterium]|jgi:isopentenyl-diphosphate delta-isomerase|nr:isopentenyl-diphosphate Delta-isomerase [Crocinitomicaceae bacterium]
MEEVILVDENDQIIGTMEKMLAHQEGRLHRAFSVIIFNDKGQMLIHQRAADKYHCGGLWTNACCSHPRLEEDLIAAGKRRLLEEMGFVTDLKHIGSFIYKVKFDNDLYEHELDHLLVGSYSDAPNPSPIEVMDWEYVEMDEIYEDIKNQPNLYTFWFKKIVLEHKDKILNSIRKNESL